MNLRPALLSHFAHVHTVISTWQNNEQAPMTNSRISSFPKRFSKNHELFLSPKWTNRKKHPPQKCFLDYKFWILFCGFWCKYEPNKRQPPQVKRSMFFGLSLLIFKSIIWLSKKRNYFFEWNCFLRISCAGNLRKSQKSNNSGKKCDENTIRKTA